MFRSAISKGIKNVHTTQRRHAGGWFNKNIRIEENAGLREISYKTWEFDVSSLARLFGYLFIPSALVYSLMVEENVIKNEQIGRVVPYGLVPYAKDEK